MTGLEIKEITHNSEEYQKTVALRDKILRKPLGLQFSHTELEKEFKDHHIAAYLNDKLIGCLLLTPVNEQIVKMRQFAIDDTFQGKGFGKLLLSEAENFATRKGYSTIVLHARISAIGFYENAGYKKQGQEFIEVTLPHYKMIKEFS